MPSKISIKIIVFFLLGALMTPMPGLAYRYNLEPGEKVCDGETENGLKSSVFYCNCPQAVTPDNFKKIRSVATDDKMVIFGNKKYFPWGDDFLCPFTYKMDNELRDEMIRTGELKVKTTTETFYYHTDHLGGTSVVTDEQGEVVEVLDYYPYGDTRISEQTRDYGTQKKFTGQEEDPESDLYYFNSRYYDQNIGRFTTQDPLFQAIGDEKKVKEITGQTQQELLANPQRLNSYSYALNNPIRSIDSTGMDAEITINDRYNTITVSTTVYLRGSAYTDEIAQNIQADIAGSWEKGWTYKDSKTGKEYSVNFDVNVKEYSFWGDLTKELGLNDKANIIDIYDPNRPELYEGEWLGGTGVRGGDAGVWEIGSPDPSAHEFGHLLGLPDTDGDSNYKGNIMAEPPGRGQAEQRDINQIISPFISEHNQRSFPWINKSTTHHLNP